MLNRILKLVRRGWLRYLAAMARRKSSRGSNRFELFGTMSFMEAGGNEIERSLRRANAVAERRSHSLALKADRGAVLARIVNAAAATHDSERLEDVTELSDEDFIKRMAR